MEVQVRRLRTVQIYDQENVFATKKSNLQIPSKRQGLNVRGALGEINTNVILHRDINNGKGANAPSEFEKKATVKRGAVRNYSHVQSKVNTGLSSKPIIQPSSRPPLRREENTVGFAPRAVIRARAALKDSQNGVKEPENVFLQAKKYQEIKKAMRLPSLKENAKENKSLLKPIIKDTTEALSNLKLDKEINLKQQYVELPETLPELPKDIEDIDAGDKNSPLLLSIYIKDIYKYLTELEEKYSIESDHLKNQISITSNMRATLIDWLVEVQRQFSLVLETFHLTVGIIDRYLQVVPNVQRNQLQLVGITAMFIASKYEEIYAPDVDDFVYVTDNAYSKSDVFKCEREIMSKLGFCLARPIPLSFLRRFTKAAHGTSKNHHLAKYFVDLSLVEYSMAHYRPSELSAAAICLSLYLLSTKKLKDVWTPTLSYYSGYTLEHIEPIMQNISKIVVNVENSKNKAVYNKYLDVTLAKVSSIPQLKGELIHELAKIPTIS